jgi:hypothetical protein
MYVFRTNLAFYLTLLAIFSFVLLAIYFPFFIGFILLLSIGVALLAVVCKGFRNGSIGVNLKYKYVVYERPNSPFAFWFFMMIGVYIGILSCVASIFFLLHKFPSFRGN